MHLGLAYASGPLGSLQSVIDHAKTRNIVKCPHFELARSQIDLNFTGIVGRQRPGVDSLSVDCQRVDSAAFEPFAADHDAGPTPVSQFYGIASRSTVVRSDQDVGRLAGKR